MDPLPKDLISSTVRGRQCHEMLKHKFNETRKCRKQELEQEQEQEQEGSKSRSGPATSRCAPAD